MIIRFDTIKPEGSTAVLNTDYIEWFTSNENTLQIKLNGYDDEIFIPFHNNIQCNDAYAKLCEVLGLKIINVEGE